MRAVAAQLAAAGIEASRLEARLLVAHAMGVEPTRILGWPETPLDKRQSERLVALVERRAAREPMAHILGTREFWGLPFRVTADVLVPRPDTETLVESVLRDFPDRGQPLRILDLGTGSGCILLAVLGEYAAAFGIGADSSLAALAVAAGNSRALGLDARVRFVAGDWDGPLGGPFDVVVSNPPYIRSAEIADLEPEVSRFDPRSALDGGPDGLDAYRRIARALPRLLGETGRAFLEVGEGQHVEVAAMLERQDLSVQGVADLSGKTRCLSARNSKIL